MNQSKKFWRNTNSFVIKTTIPLNLLRLVSINRKNPRLPQGLFNYSNKNWKLCALIIEPCASFETSNNVMRYIRSHIICQSENASTYSKPGFT